MARRALKDKFMAVLAELGGSAGNARLRDALQWTDATYAAVKDELVAEGVVIPGRGRGGSISLAGADRAKATRAAPTVPARSKPPRANGNAGGGDLGFEAELFKTADKLRGNMEPSDYKHVALGLIFLKHISDSFESKRAELLADYPDGAEDRDEYAADNVFWVPPTARWSHLQANAKQPSIGKLIDEAMIAIEKDNENLKGVLPKDYGRRRPRQPQSSPSPSNPKRPGRGLMTLRLARPMLEDMRAYANEAEGAGRVRGELTEASPSPPPSRPSAVLPPRGGEIGQTRSERG